MDILSIYGLINQFIFMYFLNMYNNLFILNFVYGMIEGYQMKDGTCKKCDTGMFRNGNMTVCTTFTVCQSDGK